MTLIKDVVNYLEGIAPSSLQESYDNSGLIVGRYDTVVTGVVICLDSIEEIVDEAIAEGANLIVAHHPIVFKGLKRFNESDYVQRTVAKAIKNDIAIYAIHTNLDSVLPGVSGKIAEKLGVLNPIILSPRTHRILKLECYVPVNRAQEVMDALFAAGAGNIGNYSNCGFVSEGRGSFQANEGASPFVGKLNEVHVEREAKIEVVFTVDQKTEVINALINAHPYEEVSYHVLELENSHQNEGLGVVGDLPKEVLLSDFLVTIKEEMKVGMLRYTTSDKLTVKRVAICGGSGSFLLSQAKRAQADLFLTADFKYHEFFDSENQIVIADIGHYESEQYTSELLYEYLTQKFSTFAIRISAINTNPVNYL